MVNRIVSQRGSTRVVIVGILVAVLIGAGGVFLWKNTSKEPVTAQPEVVATIESDTDEHLKNTGETPQLTDSDIQSMSKAITAFRTGCTLTPTKLSDFVEADPSQEYYTEGQRSTEYQKSAKIDKNIKFANVMFGCGSQGSVAVMKKQNDSWILLAESATVWVQCDDIDGTNVPVEIMPLCWESDQMTKRAVR